MGSGVSSKGAQSAAQKDAVAVSVISSPKTRPKVLQGYQQCKDEENSALVKEYCWSDENINEHSAVSQYKTETMKTSGLSPRSNLSEEYFADSMEKFAHTALSLDMDNDDLLFNLMYFEEQNANANFGHILESAQQETLALHSENNTPYKLKPASQALISSLVPEVFGDSIDHTEIECLICRDEIDVGSNIVRLPKCRHYFHEDCLIKWISLVSPTRFYSVLKEIIFNIVSPFHIHILCSLFSLVLFLLSHSLTLVSKRFVLCAGAHLIFQIAVVAPRSCSTKKTVLVSVVHCTYSKRKKNVRHFHTTIERNSAKLRQLNLMAPALTAMASWE
jgi:hypothetical protein